MAVTLAANISADAREFTVSGTVPDEIAPGYLFRLANELLILRSFARADIADAPVDPVTQPELVGRNRHIWIVGRGLQGTTKATHTAGTSIIGSADAFATSSDATPPSPFPPGGGSSTASDVTVDPAVLAATDVQAALEALAASSSPLLEVTRTLTSAEILALNSTPVTLIAGVAGKVYIPTLATFRLHFLNTDYSSSGNISIGDPAGIGGLLSKGSSAVINRSFDWFSATAGAFGAPLDTDADLTSFDGVGLQIFNDTADPIDGDGTLDVTVIYLSLVL